MGEKIDKVIVLYFNSQEVGTDKGTSCGACMLYGSQDCKIVDGVIDPIRGTCALYVNTKLPKFTAGYITNAPTHCGNCEYYNGNSQKGSCDVVKGTVDFHGCCNAWEKSDNSLAKVFK